MHLKNVALLKIANAKASAKTFMSVRFALIYDAITARVFPGFGGDRMALKLKGNDDRLTRGDFMTLARTIGLQQHAAETAIADVTMRPGMAVDTVRLPAFAAAPASARIVQDQVLGITRERAAALANDGG